MSNTSSQLTFDVALARPEFSIDVAHELALDGITALYGQNGSGKSTLLRIIAGLEPTARGHIRFNGEVWQAGDPKTMMPAHKRGIGFVFQNPRLFAHLSVAGNLAFAEKRAAVVAPGMEPPITRDAVIDALDLDGLLESSADALSGGERQRVALGRTLLSNPDLLLLDEPLSGFDRERKAEVLPYLEEATRRFEIPTLYVSHDIDEVARLADRVWVLADGRLQTSGSTAAIVERLDLLPITGRFEAGVLVEGRVARHDERLHLTCVDLHGDEFTMPLVERLEPGDPVRLRIRARDVALATRRPEGLSIRNVLPGRLVELVREPDTGSVEALVALREDRIRARLTLAAVEDLGLEVGDAVFALVKSVSFERGG